MNDELLTSEEVADRLHVKVATLHEWRYKRKGPVGFRIGNRVYWRAADVDAWLDEQHRKGKARYDE